MDFQQAETQFKQLKAQFVAGVLNDSEFKAKLEELMVQDEQGDWWMLGYETERWYRHDGNDWVQIDPPGKSVTDPIAGVPAEPITSFDAVKDMSTHARDMQRTDDPHAVERQAPSKWRTQALGEEADALQSTFSLLKKPIILYISLFIAVVFIGFCSIFGSMQINAARNANALAAARATSTANVQAIISTKASETAIFQATQTAKVKATQTQAVRLTNVAITKSTNTAIALATMESREAFVTMLNEKSKLVYGPEVGNLAHEEDDFIEVASVNVDLKDFILDATFINPYSPSTGTWDYGFLFRDEGKNSQYRLVIRSSKSWVLLNNTGDSDGKIAQEGKLPNLFTREGESNTIWLYCQGNRGLLYVNEFIVADLDLSDRINSGNIQIATGIYNGNEILGYSTDYEDFRVWEIQ